MKKAVIEGIFNMKHNRQCLNEDDLSVELSYEISKIPLGKTVRITIEVIEEKE